MITKFCFFVSTLLLLATSVFSQADLEQRIEDDLWKNCPKEFKSVAVPEKWKKESAVILAVQLEYINDITTKVTGLANVNRFYIEKVNFHYRIKLQDKAAVSEFSELEFDTKTVKSNLFGRAKAYRFIGIKVIKADGTERKVDLSQAVKADAVSDKDLKIPVPNLEPGDIVDYYMAMRNDSQEVPSLGDEYILEMKYPVVAQLVSFTIPQQFRLYSKSYNGAPAFKMEKKERDLIYTLVDVMREKRPDLIWHAPLRSAPHIRYKIHPEASTVDIAEDARKLLGYTYNPTDIGMMEDFVKIHLKKTKDQNVLTREMFYLLRNPIYKKAYHNVELGDPLGNAMSPNQFFVIADRFLSHYKIKHDLLMAPPRELGPMDEQISMASCEFLIKVNTNPPIFIPRPGPFTLPNEVPYPYEGVDAIYSGIGNIELKNTSELENSSSITLNVNVSRDDQTQTLVKRNTVVKGHGKRGHQYMIYTNYDYMKAYDLPKYQAESSGKMRDVLREFNKEKAKYEQRLTQDYHERDERIKQNIEENMDVKLVEYKDLSIKSIGMWDTSPNTEYDDEFVIENLTKKAGPNLIVDIGRLIEKQTEIKEDQATRDRAIHMPYARSFSHRILFTIPDGYTLEGTDKLNMKVENETGGFTASAVVSGRTLTIQTKKYYTKNMYTAGDWSKMVPFMNAATTFFASKVLLKKL